MENNTSAAEAQALREWTARIDRVEAELRRGTSRAIGPPDAPQAEVARRAVERARGVLAALARREEAIKAELPGTRATAHGATSLEQWAHAAAVAQDSKRSAVAMALRDVPPTDALRAAKRSRDAVLRIGVWSALGDAAAAWSSIDALMAAQTSAHAAVPPGIAPAPGWADSEDAQAFFGDHLRQVIAKLAAARDVLGGALAEALGDSPMNRTVGTAQRWSVHWSDVACAVYADWLDRRGSGSIEAARRSLWETNGHDSPVRFRPGPGLAAIPTKGHRIHVDLWLDLVLAQVLAYDAERWNQRPVDARWHAVRLAIHDLAARDVGDAADGPHTLHRGLAIEMLYAAIFVGRVDALVARQSAKVAPMSTAPAMDDSHHFDVAVPGCAAGQQITLRVVLEWGQAKGGMSAGRPSASGNHRLRDPLAQLELSLAQQQAIVAWREDQWRKQRVARLGCEALDWRPALRPAERRADEDGAASVALGHLDLWGAIDPSAMWCDFTAVGHVGGRCVVLPIERVDTLIDGALRTWLMVDRDADVDPIDTQLLRQRLGSDDTCLWVARRDGLGVFVTLGIDLNP